MTSTRYVADFSAPEVLREALDEFLRHQVCPVKGMPQPRLMLTVQFELLLPGLRETYSGRVIRVLSPDSFLVELLTPLDLSRLRRLAAAAGHTGEACHTPMPQGSNREAELNSGAKSHLSPVPHSSNASAGSVSGTESEYSDVYSKLKDLPMGEKQRLAKHGNKTVRQLLMRQGLKPLHIFVFQNPKLTMDEVVEFTKIPNLSADAIRLIIQNTTWMSSKQIVLNLVRNPSTPLDIAVRLVSQLSKNEWRILSKATTVRSPIQARARKLLMG